MSGGESRARWWTPIAAWLAFVVLWLLHATLRVRVDGTLPVERAVYAFWHGEQQLILPLVRRRARRVAVLTSLSADGRLQAAILRRLGLEVVSGSSSRGGAAGLQGLVRRVREGADGAVAVDGPRGPRHVAKPGAVQLARLSGVPVVALRARATRVWTFGRSWDRFVVPKPFARVEVEVRAVVSVPSRGGRSALAEGARALTVALGGEEPLDRSS